MRSLPSCFQSFFLKDHRSTWVASHLWKLPSGDLECFFPEVPDVFPEIPIKRPLKCPPSCIPGVSNTNLVKPLTSKCNPLRDPLAHVPLDDGHFNELKLKHGHSVGCSHRFLQAKYNFIYNFNHKVSGGLLTPPYHLPACWAVGFQNPDDFLGSEQVESFRYMSRDTIQNLVVFWHLYLEFWIISCRVSLVDETYTIILWLNSLVKNNACQREKCSSTFSLCQRGCIIIWKKVDTCPSHKIILCTIT